MYMYEVVDVFISHLNVNTVCQRLQTDNPDEHPPPPGNSKEFKGKDCVFVADWLKTKGLHKLCFVFEGVKNEFLSI